MLCIYTYIFYFILYFIFHFAHFTLCTVTFFLSYTYILLCLVLSVLLLLSTNFPLGINKVYFYSILFSSVPPRVIRPGGVGDAASREVILNNPVSLHCDTNAVPPPTLTWYKDGRLLASSHAALISPGGRVLQIPRSQAEDSGRYTCVAVNEAGEDSLQYDVRVLLPPTIRGAGGDAPDEVTVLVNRTTQLECQVDGSPAPKVTWFQNSQPVVSDGPHRLLSNGRTLQVLTAQVSDTGRYVCVADSVAGTAEKSFNLNVHMPPSIMGRSPESVSVLVNGSVSLSCEATGFPPPTVSWLNDRGPVQAHANALIVPGAGGDRDDLTLGTKRALGCE
ncbi:Hemicentin-1 [Liparis tanakae]|uniref:Hemicentin-1 n=1 Tax=Liparis tanakae TaxID=230148 RepID=A0A4Z2GS68_9TELE|nr:Hemicentin-1 [Liparis tanakae]